MARAVAAVFAIAGICLAGSLDAGMSSSQHSIPQLVENGGGGSRASATYQIPADLITAQPIGMATSSNYTLHGRPLVTSASNLPSCGIFIDGNRPSTNTTSVSLGLICGHSSGCAQVQLSNNGVSWSAAMPYSPSKPWTLLSNDGTRTVFAKFRNGIGNWSGVCSDSIVLDTTAPSVGISPTGGTYMSTQSLAITANEPATIKYTLDGSDPKTSGTAQTYGSPISMAANGTVTAFATDDDGNAGANVSETYEICTGGGLGISGYVRDATRENAPMPLVVITLDSGHTATTNTSGAYSFGALPRGYYTIVSVTTPVAGYVTYQSKLKLCQSSVTHDVVLTRDGTVFGTDTSSGYSADGVNTSTGNYAFKIADLSIAGKGPSVVFERAYNSQDASNGPLGYSWTWNYNISLTDGPDGELVMRWGDGKVEVWAPDGSGGYKPMYGVFSTLIKNGDNTFTLRRKDLIEYRFNAARKLASVVDEYANAITFGYSGSQLTTITDTSGRVFTLSYDASNRITNLIDPIGRSVSFVYDGNGDLVRSTNMGGETTTYEYDADHQMTRMTDPKGNPVMTNLYDTSRRVVTSQRDALGGETRYNYDPTTRTTTILDAMGNTAYHRFDEFLRLVQETDARGNSASFVFDTRGNMTSTTDKRGNVTSFTHDANGNVLTKTEPLGRVTSATYDAKNNPLTKTNARGYSQVFEYDPITSNLTASYDCGAVPVVSCATDPSVRKTTYTYESFGKLATMTDAAGHLTLERTTTYQYDIAGNQVAIIDAMGNTSTFTFDGVGRKLTETHPLDRATAYEYDAMDRLISVTDALGGQSLFVYDANGNKISHRDARENWIQFTYDAKDRLVTKTDALGGTEVYWYDALDRRTAITNPRGATSTVVYDVAGNVLTEIDALGNVVSYEYDANGNRTASTDPRGYKSTSTYDALNRLVAATDPLGNTVTTQYDLNGNRTKVIDALGKETTFTYDAFDRLLTVVDPLGNTTTNTYDLLGRLVNVRDARGNETTFEYDLLDRLKKVTDSAGGIVTAAYDALGNRTGVTDPRGKTTAYEYDILNRLIRETDPLGNASVMTYDAVGNLKSLTNADGTTTYFYDDDNRLTDLTYPNATTVAYTFDANGNRTKLVDSAGTTTYAYDFLDRLSSVTDVWGMTVGYTYDPSGNRSSTKYPGNKAVTYLYDALDRMVTVEDWGGVRTTYSYDDAGRLAGQVIGNGATVRYGYDVAGRLISKEDRTAGGAVIASYTYTLDANGNRTGLDAIQPTLPDIAPFDDLLVHNDAGQVVIHNGSTHSYDARGNRQTTTTATSTRTYQYDFNNRLTHVSSGADSWEYRYTSDGLRIATVESGTTNRFLLDTNAGFEFVLADMTVDNAISIYYVYGAGLLCSIDALSGERKYHHHDPLGSTVALTNQNGEVTSGMAYHPLGQLSGQAESLSTRFTFVGRFGVSRETNGLYFMRARFYDPDSGSFLAKDPIEGTVLRPQSLGRYTYVEGNPVALVDPTGLITAVVPAPVAGARTPVAPSPKGSFFKRWFLRPKRPTQPDDSFFPEENRKGLATIVLPQGDPTTPPAQSGPETGIPTSAEDDDAERRMLRLFVVNKFALKVFRALHSRSEDESQVTASNDPTDPSFAEEASQQSNSAPSRPRKKYLNVASYARSMIVSDFDSILGPNFLDTATRSWVEQGIDHEAMNLSTRRYGYRTKEQKKKAVAKRARDVAAAEARLYSQLVSALSKHEVMIRDLSALPKGSSGGIASVGVYAGR